MMEPLAVEQISVKYQAFTLGPISTILEPGSVTALMGTNGSGKSSLIRAILGLQTVASGDALWGDENLRDRSDHVLSRVGYVSDSHRDLLAEFCPSEYWQYCRLAYERARGARSTEYMERAERYARLLDFPYGTRIPISGLSLGTARKVQIIGALLADPSLIIMDEPFSGLDFIASRALESMLVSLRSEGKTILLANHDLDLATRLADKVLLLHSGSLLLDAPVGEFHSHSELERTIGSLLQDARQKLVP